MPAKYEEIVEGATGFYVWSGKRAGIVIRNVRDEGTSRRFEAVFTERYSEAIDVGFVWNVLLTEGAVNPDLRFIEITARPNLADAIFVD